MKKYVLYHASCADGFGAAFSAWLKFGDEAEYIPVQYGRPVPEFPSGCDIFILDFSYPAEVLLKMGESARMVVVLDHHTTAQAALSPEKFMKLVGIEKGHLVPDTDLANDGFNRFRNVLIKFDMSKSGAVLAWEYFHIDTPKALGEPTSPVPEFFLYLQDRDLWQWKKSSSREVSDAIRSYPFDFNQWKRISRICVDCRLEGDEENAIEELSIEGNGIRRMTRQIVENAARNFQLCNFWKTKEAVAIEIGELVKLVIEPEFLYHVPSLNCTAFISETCEEMLKQNPASPFVATYFDSKDATRIWSIRSRPDFDCSVVAKGFGGGGHKQAAGFIQKL